jgi:high-affinity nickel permease
MPHAFQNTHISLFSIELSRQHVAFEFSLGKSTVLFLKLFFIAHSPAAMTQSTSDYVVLKLSSNKKLFPL